MSFPSSILGMLLVFGIVGCAPVQAGDGCTQHEDCGDVMSCVAIEGGEDDGELQCHVVNDAEPSGSSREVAPPR